MPKDTDSEVMIATTVMVMMIFATFEKHANPSDPLVSLARCEHCRKAIESQVGASPYQCVHDALQFIHVCCTSSVYHSGAISTFFGQ